jgi:hypothetical protein
VREKPGATAIAPAWRPSSRESFQQSTNLGPWLRRDLPLGFDKGGKSLTVAVNGPLRGTGCRRSTSKAVDCLPLKAMAVTLIPFHVPTQ